MKKSLNTLNFDDGFKGYRFYNYSDDENRWNKVIIKTVHPEGYDIENIDGESDEYKNVWTITDGEFTNVNNSKRFL
tara:strand:+ start:39247 stop:39474 length:228 start_codon:yes stop_codon:yes gene_type:complete